MKASIIAYNYTKQGWYPVLKFTEHEITLLEHQEFSFDPFCNIEPPIEIIVLDKHFCADKGGKFNCHVFDVKSLIFEYKHQEEEFYRLMDIKSIIE